MTQATGPAAIRAHLERLESVSTQRLASQLAELERTAPELSSALALLGFHAAAQIGLFVDSPPPGDPNAPWAARRGQFVDGHPHGDPRPLRELRSAAWWSHRWLTKLRGASVQLAAPMLPANWCEKLEARLNEDGMWNAVMNGIVPEEIVELGC